jgi:hypothetical protein
VGLNSKAKGKPAAWVSQHVAAIVNDLEIVLQWFELVLEDDVIMNEVVHHSAGVSVEPQ